MLTHTPINLILSALNGLTRMKEWLKNKKKLKAYTKKNKVMEIKTDEKNLFGIKKTKTKTIKECTGNIILSK